MVDQVNRYQTRRQILKAALGGAAGIVLGTPVLRLPEARAQAASEAAGTLKLTDNLLVLRMPGEANVVAQTSADGVLLVDGGSAAGSDALMKAVAALPGGGPVHTIFNTHWHPEQTGSNERLGKAGATIIAHENTRLWLTTDITWPWNGQRFKRLPKIAQPNKTFYDTGKLDFGRSLRLHPGCGAHRRRPVRLLSQQNVLAVGDAVSDRAGPSSISGPAAGLAASSAACSGCRRWPTTDTRIVPARGPVLGLAELKAQSEMYGTIYDRLSQLLNKGRGPGEAVAAQPTKEFEAKMGNPDEFVRRAFESLWAYVSPDA